MHRDRVQHPLDRALAADLADLRRVVAHPLEDLEDDARSGTCTRRSAPRRRLSTEPRRHSASRAPVLASRPWRRERVRCRRAGQSPTPAPSRCPSAELGLRTFWLGVAGCTSAVAVFLLARLTAWPPHEDETLALFVGRQSLRRPVRRPCSAERGGAPLHFLFAWLVAHLGGGLVGAAALLGAVRGRVASRSSRSLVRAARGADGRRSSRPRSSSASWMLLFHGIYGRMYSLFLLTSALSYLALPGRGRARRPAALGALGGRDPGDGRDAPVRRARARLAGSSMCSRARARGAAIVAFAAVAVLGIAVLVHATSSSPGGSTSASAAAGRSSTGRVAVLALPVPRRGRLHAPGSRRW